ncbi:MAG: GDSL-type esterase/lipase family protein [Armatimonadota bacterium]
MIRSTIVAIALVCACAVAAAATAPINLALNRPYASSCPTLPGWTGLLDGDKDSDSAPGCFATSNEEAYPKYVVIDLGADCAVSKVIVYNSSNGNTRTVSLSSSVDGVNYKKLRDPDFIFADREPTALTVGFQQPRPVRYVRVTFLDSWKNGLGGDNCMFLREVEVFGTRGEEKADNSFAFASGQATCITNRSLDIFRRYCLESPEPMKITVIGDYFIGGSDEDSHWVRQAGEELAKLYPGKKITLTAVGGSDGAIAYGTEWCKEHRGALAPDLVLLAYGSQAASVGADQGEFRSKYQQLVNELLDNTQALVIAITPPPFLQDPTLALSSKTEGRNTRGYAWQVEQVALSRGLPLVRSAAVLSRIPGDKRPLYVDNMHLSSEGQRALGLAIADLLR